VRPIRHSLTALALLIGLATLPACQADDPPDRGAGPEKTWVLQDIDGKPFPARATLEFPEAGRLAGTAPCNRYFGTRALPYPNFDAKGIGATKRACPDLAAEGLFFAALEKMTRVEISGDTLVLSADTGAEMRFTAE